MPVLFVHKLSLPVVELELPTYLICNSKRTEVLLIDSAFYHSDLFSAIWLNDLGSS
jgi:hypothetical protein